MCELWGLAAAVSNYVDQTLPNSKLKHITYYKQASSFDLRGFWISLVASWSKLWAKALLGVIETYMNKLETDF